MSDLSLIALSARTAALLLAPEGARYRLPRAVDWTLAPKGGDTVASGRAQLAPLFVEGLDPGRDYVLTCDLGSLAFTTPPCAGLIEASDFGARPDSADNTAALARAIAAVPAGGCLRLDPGRYLTGPVFLKSDMTLWLPEGAEIAAHGDRTGWPVLPAHDDTGRVIGTWEGVPEPSFAAPVTALGCTGLTITGRGVIDGGGDRGDWWSWPKETRDGARRPRTLYLAHCSGAVLSGFTVRNSPSWTVHPYRCDDLTAVALTIRNPPDSPNTDGFNPESCLRARLIGLDISVGDDCVAVKAGKRLAGQAAHLAPTRDLQISHCHMARGHGAVVMGSEMSGDITDVRIANCLFDGTDRGLRLKTRRGRGGRLARITMENVDMRGVPTPLAVNALYFCDPDGRSAAVQDRAPAPVDATTPEISGITLRRVTATGVAQAAAAVLGLPEAPARGIAIEDMRVSYDPAAREDVPLMALNVVPVRHGGILADFAEVTGTLRVQADDKEQTDMLTGFFDAYAAGHAPYKGGAWCYEDGCIYRGLECLHRATGEARWLDHLTRLVSAQVGAGPSLAGYDPNEYNIDNILSGRALLYLHEVTGEGRWLDTAGLLIDQLATHPRTHSGVYWHKLRYPWQVWLDGLYMGAPFQVGYGLRTGRADLVEDALRQVATALDMMHVPETGLYAHAVDEARKQPWADPETGQSPAHWARALGWLAMALVDLAELVGPAGFVPLKGRTKQLLKAIAALRRPDGLWLQVIDRPDLDGNYPESSASAMFVYALLKGRTLGLWSGEAEGLHTQLAAGVVRDSPGGGQAMVEICEVAGLGAFQGRYRDGSAEYYLSEARVSDDAKGVGPLMMSFAAHQEAGRRPREAVAGE